MTDTTHTPGPWFIRKNFNGRGALDLFGEGGQIIIGNALLINQEANARLIAAAPDLLAACEAMAAQLGGGDNFDQWEEAKAQLLAANAKAKGA